MDVKHHVYFTYLLTIQCALTLLQSEQQNVTDGDKVSRLPYQQCIVTVGTSQQYSVWCAAWSYNHGPMYLWSMALTVYSIKQKERGIVTVVLSS